MVIRTKETYRLFGVAFAMAGNLPRERKKGGAERTFYARLHPAARTFGMPAASAVVVVGEINNRTMLAPGEK